MPRVRGDTLTTRAEGVASEVVDSFLLSSARSPN